MTAKGLLSGCGRFNVMLLTPTQVFPAMVKYGGELKKYALAVRDQTDREDLRTMANMYANNLEGEMKRPGRYLASFGPCYLMCQGGAIS